MRRKKPIYDSATELALKRASNAISMITGKLLNKNLSTGERNSMEAQLKSLKTLKKTIREAYSKAIAEKFKSSVDSLITELGSLNPSKNNIESDF